MIRLQRVGRKNDPTFRVVVMQKQKDSQSGKFIEILGSYNARYGEPQLKAERIKYWLGVGAQASGTLHNLLIKQKIITGKKVNVLPRKSPPVSDVALETKAEEKPTEPGPDAPAEPEAGVTAKEEPAVTSDAVATPAA